LKFLTPDKDKNEQASNSQSASHQASNSQSASHQASNSQSAFHQASNSQSASHQASNNQSASNQAINSQSAPLEVSNSQSASLEVSNSQSASPEVSNSHSTSMCPEMDKLAEEAVVYCLENDISNPSEILRAIQNKFVIGRNLEVQRVDEVSEGLTRYILVDRKSLLITAFDEIQEIALPDLRLTLEVDFYGEVCRSFFILFPAIPTTHSLVNK